MSNEPVSLEVCNPRGEVEVPPVYSLSPRISDLTGRKIGLYSNGKHGVNFLFDALESLLKKRFSDLTTVRITGGFEIKNEDAAQFTSEIDGFIYAAGD